jgi:molybdopterin converting factor small subunit
VADTGVTVRYFAAARAAAGTEEEVVAVAPGATLADLVEMLSRRDAELSRVLKRCSYLRDSFAIRDHQIVIKAGQTVDVLPPFAGG